MNTLRLPWIGLVLAAGLAAFGTGCPLMDLGEPGAIVSNPAGYEQVLSQSDSIWAEFPFAPDKASAEAAFLVSGASGRASGRFVWRERRVTFIPEPALTLGARYLFELSGTIRDSAGKRYDVYQAVPFFYGLATAGLPQVVASQPAAGGQLASTGAPIIVDFNAAMSPAAVKDALSLTPSQEMVQTWSAGDTRLTLTPRTAWGDLATYTLKITTTAAAANGVPLAADFVLTFRAQADQTPPQLLTAEAALDDPATGYAGGGLTLNTLRFKDVLRLTFSEAMDKEKTKAAVSLTPLPAGEWIWATADRLVFVCADGWVMNRRYNLTVAESARDSAGNPLPAAMTWDFTAGIPALELVTLGIKPADGPPIVPAADGGAFHQLTPDAPPDRAYSFVLSFNRPFPTDAEKLSIQRALSFTQQLAPVAAGAPYLIGFSWTTASILSLTYHNVVPGTADTAAYYLFSLQGGENGAQNAEGSFMERDVKLWFRAAP